MSDLKYEWQVAHFYDTLVLCLCFLSLSLFPTKAIVHINMCMYLSATLTLQSASYICSILFNVPSEYRISIFWSTGLSKSDLPKAHVNMYSVENKYLTTIIRQGEGVRINTIFSGTPCSLLIVVKHLLVHNSHDWSCLQSMKTVLPRYYLNKAVKNEFLPVDIPLLQHGQICRYLYFCR